MKNVDVRPEAIKLNASSDETFKKTFVFELRDGVKVELDFKLKESDIDYCLSNEGLDKLHESYPDYYDKYQFNDFYAAEAQSSYPEYFSLGDDGELMVDDKLYLVEPKYYLENQIKKEFINTLPEIILGSIIDKALDSKRNLKEFNKVKSTARTEIAMHIANDEDVKNFFITCGVYTETH